MEILMYGKENFDLRLFSYGGYTLSAVSEYQGL